MSAPAVSDLPAPPVRRAIALLSLAAFASQASMRVADPMLPRIAEDFQIDIPAAAAIITAFTWAYGLMQLIYGPTSDRVGKYRLVSIGTFACCAASMACALAPDLGSLTWARLITGGLASSVVPVSIAWIGDQVAFEHRQRFLARFLNGSILGIVGGQWLGGVFSDTLGWRGAFVVLALAFLGSGIMLVRQARQLAPDPRMARPGGSPLALFAPYLELLSDRWVRYVIGFAAAEGFLGFGVLAFVPTMTHQRFDLPLWHAGMVASGFALGGLIYTALMRPLYDLLGQRGLVAAGGVGMAAGLTAAGLAPSWPVALIGCTVFGLGFYGFHNTLQTYATQMYPPQRGLGMSVFAMGVFAGQSIGVGLVSLAGQRLGFTAAFVLCGLALGVTALIFHHLLKQRQKS